MESYSPKLGWDDKITFSERPVIDLVTQMRSGTQILVFYLLKTFNLDLIEFYNGKLVQGDLLRIQKITDIDKLNIQTKINDCSLIKRHHYHNRHFPLKYDIRIIVLGDVMRSIISDLYALRNGSNSQKNHYTNREFFDEKSIEWIKIKPYYDDLFSWYQEIYSGTYSDEKTIIIRTLSNQSLSNIVTFIESRLNLKRNDIELEYNIDFPFEFSPQEILSRSIIDYVKKFEFLPTNFESKVVD